ncbi:substrate-binding domain-containing protein [Sinorhizobium meliloti]|uniref:substrate-binding domain-containing protein n=2 Tax=Rhizobium meliloti TaxID=382 RepID=UPI002D786F9D|nr:substrate-binding domain-containing protein [Sinorhizobium meliloti]
MGVCIDEARHNQMMRQLDWCQIRVPARFRLEQLDAARLLDRPVPHGLRLATRYDGMRAKLATPQLTAVNLHLDQVAEAAIDLLIAAMEGKEPQRHAIAPPLLVARESSAA